MQASFKYDALGRRIEKTINGKTTQYLYDGLDIVQEIEGGMVSTNYIRTLNIDEPLARVKADGTVRYYQQDALGSVVALTDESGVIKTQYVYDPFGNAFVIGEPSDNPIQFAGRENDGGGHLSERNRTYHVELQRYISQDPIGLAGGDINYYVRVGNNPANYIDPYGLIGGVASPGGIGGTTGEAVGGATGVIGGTVLGTQIGMNLGFATGGALGLGGGPLGSLGGGIAGGYVGGFVGGVVGGWIGGQMGGAIGGLFDNPCAGQLNCNEPMPPQPVQPSQCH